MKILHKILGLSIPLIFFLAFLGVFGGNQQVPCPPDSVGSECFESVNATKDFALAIGWSVLCAYLLYQPKPQKWIQEEKIKDIRLAEALIEENQDLIIKAWIKYFDNWIRMTVKKIWFDNKNIFLETKDGIVKSMPLDWFPRLEQASVEQRNEFELSAFGIHWEELDEDLSFEGFFKFQKKEVNTSS